MLGICFCTDLFLTFKFRRSSSVFHGAQVWAPWNPPSPRGRDRLRRYLKLQFIVLFYGIQQCVFFIRDFFIQDLIEEGIEGGADVFAGIAQGH